MGRLFWKIFLWFWLTLLMIVSAVFIATSLYLQSQNDDERRRIRPHFQVQAIFQVLSFSGADAARAMLQQTIKKSARRSIFVVDESNRDLLGRRVPAKLLESKSARQTITPTGKKYRVLSSSRRFSRAKNKRPFFMRVLERTVKQVGLLWLGIALALSSLVCFWLAWYLSSPIRKLQHAAQQLSQGNLSTRVSQKIGNRRDEIADLGDDFDVMAAHLQKLISNQKQLLSDVSHELRSPLARLQVAVALARQKGNKKIEADLRRIEHETERLDDLVGQSLTLSRLDAGADYPMDDYIDIATLLEDIVNDGNFEASDQNKKVVFQYTQSWTIKANAELLRRALENIIRNAIQYTPSKSTVDVFLGKNPDSATDFLIHICDQGQGVPEDKLEDLFEPFVRISSARDRDSGGYGLGLAIAKRAVLFHQGSIKAYNQLPQGLCIKIVLPLP